MRHALGRLVGRISDSRRDRLLATLAAMVAAAALELLAHSTLRAWAGDTWVRMVADGGIVGIGAGVFVWLLLAGNCDRRRLVREQLARVASLNHNIRNALEVIVGAHHGEENEHYRMVMESVERIEKAISDLYPVVGGDTSDLLNDAKVRLRKNRRNRLAS